MTDEPSKYLPAVQLGRRGKGVPRNHPKKHRKQLRLRMIAINEARAAGNSADRRKARREAARKLKAA